ncbi:MAG: LysE family transporter [Deltaproteobacteria bacterium]|nr:LysE family transporter [Deltaproteobacteria bacterium]
METALNLISILLVLSVGVVSPGPSFILVARTAVAISRLAAVSSALGMAAGATVLCIAALLGLHALLHQIPAAAVALRVVGGAYLLYLAFGAWRGARLPIELAGDAGSSADRLPRHFTLAAATMLSNPKAAVQYGVIFAAMLPRSPSVALVAALPPSIFALEAGWYLIVAFALSAPGPRSRYLQAKAAIDRTAGVILGLLGVRLLLSFG